jgi:outer membrane murein-binding lipoprotein Lpp
MAILAGFLLASCVEQASEQQIGEMCKKLAALRSVADPAEVEKNLTECKAEAAKEGVSKAKAECRIKAADVDTYWNKCR